MQKAYKIDTKQIEGRECDIEFPFPHLPGELELDEDEDPHSWGRELIDEELELHLSAINKARDNYVACVNNFGWRKYNASQEIRVKNESDILSCILPKTECHFKIWLTETGFLLQNFHHDSPTGEEWYEVKIDGSEDETEEENL